MKNQKSFEEIAKKVQSLEEDEQGKLKGGFAAITPETSVAESNKQEEGNGNCVC